VSTGEDADETGIIFQICAAFDTHGLKAVI
jgi:hypothetical protein